MEVLFISTGVVALAEIGDKTQLLAFIMVVMGTTLGMLLAVVPAVFIGDKMATKIPMKLVHSIAATIFALLGLATLLGAGARLGF
jgi:Ca2+/H+ antiporter, TMEM165/GDT1 family